MSGSQFGVVVDLTPQDLRQALELVSKSVFLCHLQLLRHLEFREIVSVARIKLLKLDRTWRHPQSAKHLDPDSTGTLEHSCPAICGKSQSKVTG